MMRMATALVLASVASVVLAQESRPPFVVKAKLVVPVEGPDVERGAVRISGTKIDAIGVATGDNAPDRRVLEFPDGIVYPGLIDAGSYAGIRRERDDGLRPLLPSYRAAEAFDPLHPAFAKNLAAGITTAHLVPGNAAVIGGRSAVVKVAADGTYRIVMADAGLKLSLVEAAYPEVRAPTSLLGALALLQAPPADVATELEPFRNGTQTAFVAAMKPREIQLAAGLGKEFGFRTVVMSDLTCGRYSNEIAAGCEGVIVDALPLGRNPHEWRDFAELVATGKPIAFASWAPLKSPATLRFSAVAAAKRGIAPAVALRALTIDAARLLRIDASVGSLKAGKDADLIVLSAPIEDARSRLLLCVQDGKVVYTAPKESP